MKKIISIFLICAIIICTIPINVLAADITTKDDTHVSDTGTPHGGGGGSVPYSWRNPTKQELDSLTSEQKQNISAQSIRRAIAQFGALVNGDFEKMVAGNDAYKTWLLRYIESGQIMVANEDTNIFHLSEGSVQDLKNVLTGVIKEQQTFVVYKTKSADDIVPGLFTSYPQYLSTIKALKDNQLVYFAGCSDYGSVSHPTSTIVPLRDVTFYAEEGFAVSGTFSDMLEGKFNMYYGMQQGCFKYQAKALNKKWEEVKQPYQYKMIWPSTEFVVDTKDSVYTDWGYMPSQIYSYKGDIIPFFKDTIAAKNYMAGYSNIYMGTPRSESGSITIPSNVNTTDFDKLYSKIAESIRNSGGEMGTSDITTMVDDELKKLLAQMGSDIGDIGESTGESVGLLAEIRDILKSIKNWIVATFVVNTADAVVNLIDKLFGQKEGEEEVDIGNVVSSAFSDFSVLAKSKFPFSIPWDLMFVVKLLSAPPKAPVFEIPFVIPSLGYSEVIVIDLAKFSALSNISRTFLTLLWAYVLILSSKALIRRD